MKLEILCYASGQDRAILSVKTLFYSEFYRLHLTVCGTIACNNLVEADRIATPSFTQN